MRQDEFELQLRDTHARRAVHWAGAEAAIDWAVSALEAGHDTPSLRQLAGLTVLSTSVFEVDELIQRIFKEVGLAVPTSEDAKRWLLRDVARRICDGSLDGDEGATQIYRLAGTVEGCALSHNWIMLCDHLHPETYADLEGDALTRVVKQYAARIVAAG